MAPGRKLGTSERTPAEASPSEYEKLKAQNILRNSLALQRLGVSAASSILNSSIANMTKSKGRQASAREHSDPLYKPEDDEDDDDSEEDVADKGSTRNISMCRGGTRVSKRVMAPEEQDRPAKRTRQRTRELSATVESCHEGSVHDEAENHNQVQIDNEDNEGQTRGMIDRWNRGPTMGKDLDRISRGLCTKLPIKVSEGMKRPEAPIQAAKLASETGIILRQHIPILPRWKDYKDKANRSYFENYVKKLAGRFTIDSDNKAVKDALWDLFKSGIRQLRYKLKKMYFDGIPANEVRTTSPLASMTDEQWMALVEMWSSPKHKDKCAKNKDNREKVVIQQRTGSRCFVAHCHAVKQDKYKDVPATWIDLFKECYCSSKTGFTEPVQKVIADMEARITEPIEGQEPKSPTQIISEVLPKSRFLQTAGIVAAAPKRNGKAAVSSRVEELESQLAAEKQEATALREQLDAQQLEMGELKKHVQDSNAQIETLKQQASETDIILRKLLLLNKL